MAAVALLALGIVDHDEVAASETPADIGRSDEGEGRKIIVVESLVVDLHRINLWFLDCENFTASTFFNDRKMKILASAAGQKEGVFQMMDHQPDLFH